MLLAVEEGAAEIVEVPAWAPDSLAWLYLDIARTHGEEAAAAHARRLGRAVETAPGLIDGDFLSEDTPEARNQRLGHLARLADELTAQELRLRNSASDQQCTCRHLTDASLPAALAISPTRLIEQGVPSDDKPRRRKTEWCAFA